MVSDGLLSSAEATVDVLVQSVNDPPTPVPATLSIIGGQPTDVALSAVDVDGDPVLYALHDPPARGMAVVNAASGLLTYTPDTNDFTGPDVLVWEATDGFDTVLSILPIQLSADSDDDGIGDDVDNCPDVPNTNQLDAGNNGVGDACDCVRDVVGPVLDPDLWATSFLTDVLPENVASAPHALRLTGDGAYLETVALPGCSSYHYELRVAAGPPAPEVSDALVISVRQSGGPWQLLDEQFGTGTEESYALLEGETLAIGDLSTGTVEFRFEVVGDEPDDVFYLDDIVLACDSDADRLVDCVESTLPGYDLTEPDADGEGLLDAGEYAKGTDPNVADTDGDGFDDLLDNCGVLYNPGQFDADSNLTGDACEGPWFYETFEAGVLGAYWWAFASGEAWAETTAVYARGAASMCLNGPRNAPAGGAPGTGLPGVAVTQAIDLSSCTHVAVSFEVVDRDAEIGDDLLVSTFDGVMWNPLTTIDGARQNGVWNHEVHSVPVGPGFQSFAVRFEHTSASWDDRFYIDNLSIDCDADGDGVGDALENIVLGTDPFVADTDADGSDDGTELIQGTDPLLP